MMTFKEQYYKIIQYRQAHPLEDGVFGEIHHIYPKSLFPQFKHSDWNLIKLTPQEHYDCHELLVKWFEEEGDINGYQKMMYAWNQISHTREGLVINAEQYAEMKERFATMLSETRKDENNPMKGRKHSDDAKKKMSEACKGKNKGKNNPNYKPFKIDGIRFERLADAAKHFNVSNVTIHRWLHNPDKYNHNCKYL